MGEHTIDVMLERGELCKDEFDNEPAYLHGEGLGVVSLLLLSLPPSTLLQTGVFELEDLLRLDEAGRSSEVLAAAMVFSPFSEFTSCVPRRDAI